jgi:hypothetical protein
MTALQSTLNALSDSPEKTKGFSLAVTSPVSNAEAAKASLFDMSKQNARPNKATRLSNTKRIHSFGKTQILIV